MKGLLAHGIGGIRDLPVPLWLFYYGAALVLLLSFIALWALWTKPRLDALARGRPLPGGLQRILLSRAVRIVLGTVGLGLFLLVAAAALAGEPSPTENIAPTFVYVVFWLGVVALVVVFGNVWAWLSPWRAAADLVAWAGERLGVAWEPPLEYPERLGRRPAAFLLFCFATLELAYVDPANPRALALAVYLYSAVTWLGMLTFGRRAWLENGEAFGVYFGFLARLSPFALRENSGRPEVVVRPPILSVSLRDARPGTLAFVGVMLGTVAFDGFSRTSWWIDSRYDVSTGLAADSPRLGDAVITLFNVAGLLALVLAVAGAFALAVRAAERLADRHDLAAHFLASLLPIALAYAVAHYFSLLFYQAQAAVALASDPFGWGWDLFGTAGYLPDFGALSANAIWYIQVGALVLGHVAGLVLAHDRAVSVVGSPRLAVATQYPMLVLMVLYTVGGLWLLSAG
ncbi:MAG TPA: hypothetical protein VHF23_07815 [Gaiellaceae bacterium]|nr:hypothetical protein [Gaiellaceae bacterium]